jgi:signal transduction histidine kinase
VKELLRNLVSNGLKYNHKEERSISIGCTEAINPRSRTNESQVFYVKDNGIGIPEHFHEDIFRIFKRLAPNDANNKGSGVGLTFVKRIVERHMGEIWLESDGENGSCFYFTLPSPIAGSNQ